MIFFVAKIDTTFQFHNGQRVDVDKGSAIESNDFLFLVKEFRITPIEIFACFDIVYLEKR